MEELNWSGAVVNPDLDYNSFCILYFWDIFILSLLFLFSFILVFYLFIYLFWNSFNFIIVVIYLLTEKWLTNYLVYLEQFI